MSEEKVTAVFNPGSCIIFSQHNFGNNREYLHIHGELVTQSSADVVPVGIPRPVVKDATRRSHSPEAYGIRDGAVQVHAELADPPTDNCAFAVAEKGDASTIVIRTFDRARRPCTIHGHRVRWSAIGALGGE